MNNKGLCSTCVNDGECTFPRQFPVLYCEEFTELESKSRINKKTNKKNR